MARHGRVHPVIGATVLGLNLVLSWLPPHELETRQLCLHLVLASLLVIASCLIPERIFPPVSPIVKRILVLATLTELLVGVVYLDGNTGRRLKPGLAADSLCE
jgi:integral membrane sensor domain MASE1